MTTCGMSIIVVDGLKKPKDDRRKSGVLVEMRLLEGLGSISGWNGTSHPHADELLEWQSLRRVEHYIPMLGDCILVVDRVP